LLIMATRNGFVKYVPGHFLAQLLAAALHLEIGYHGFHQKHFDCLYAQVISLKLNIKTINYLPRNLSTSC